MPVARTQLPGMFGGGSQPLPPQTLDYGAAIQSVFHGASSLLQNAVLRRVAEQNRQFAREQAMQARADRQAQLAIAQQREAREAAGAAFTQDLATRRLALDQQRADDEAARRKAELGAKGIVPAADVTERERAVDVSGVAGEGAPPATAGGLDAAHYEPVGGGFVRDKLHNPETSRHAAAEDEIRLRARLRPPSRGRADPVAADTRRTEHERRAFIARRITALTTPKRDHDNDVIHGSALSLEAAKAQAQREWETVNAPAAPTAPAPAVAPPAPTTGVGDISLGPSVRPSPVGGVTGPRLRTPGTAPVAPPAPTPSDPTAALYERAAAAYRATVASGVPGAEARARYDRIVAALAARAKGSP